MSEGERLRDLHDTYVWQVNAAVGEDRMDLVWRLVDDYVDEAFRILSASEPAVCDRPDCPACTATREAAPPRRPRPRIWAGPWRRR